MKGLVDKMTPFFLFILFLAIVIVFLIYSIKSALRNWSKVKNAEKVAEDEIDNYKTGLKIKKINYEKNHIIKKLKKL